MCKGFFSKKNWHFFILISSFLLLNGCTYFVAKPNTEIGVSPTGPIDEDFVEDAIPKPATRSRYGNPKSYIINGKRYYTLEDNHGFTQQGLASWYGKKFHGRRTSSGETYDMYAMTAAHKTLILPVYVEVTNLENGKKVVVKVNDRGPFHEDRIIDLSYIAAQKLDIVKTGTGKVKLRVVESGGATAKQSVTKKQSVIKKHKAPIQSLTVKDSEEEFFIQVGSFVDLINAESLRDKLSIIGGKIVSIQQTLIENTTFHRVMIGPLFNNAHADTIIKKLIEANEYNHHIIVY